MTCFLTILLIKSCLFCCYQIPDAIFFITQFFQAFSYEDRVNQTNNQIFYTLWVQISSRLGAFMFIPFILAFLLSLVKQCLQLEYCQYYIFRYNFSRKIQYGDNMHEILKYQLKVRSKLNHLAKNVKKYLGKIFIANQNCCADDYVIDGIKYKSELYKVFALTKTVERQQRDIMQYQFKVVMKQVTPYYVFSGRIPDDLGIPTTCVNQPGNKYFTVEMLVNYQEELNQTVTMYYGLCFSNSCNVEDMNQYGVFLLNAFFGEQIVDPQAVLFIEPSFQLSMNAGCIVMYCVFGLLLLVFMVDSFINWGIQCAKDPPYQIQQEQTYTKFQDSQQQEVAPRYQPEPQSILQKISLEVRFKRFISKQESLKIMQFSLFKIIVLPIIVYGQIFYLTNYGAFNYFDFNAQIYQTFYARIALFAYYIPDVFFFISGFLFARKMFTFDEYKEQKYKFLFRGLGKKFARLYPIYIFAILMFWFITPTYHAGPVWYVYQKQTQICYTSWWRALILIDNWWTEGCYNPAWFVQVQLQLVIISTLIFCMYFFRRIITVVIISVFTFALWVLLYAFSAKMPISLNITIDDFSQQYFRSTYSHAPFYFFGWILAMVSQKQSVRSVVVSYFVEKISFVTLTNFVSFAILVIVWLRPSIWDNDLLSLQLALCRTGVFFAHVLLFLPGIFNNQLHKTRIHKLAYYTYPVILVSGFICMSSFWSYQTFPYVSALSLLNNLVPLLLISIFMGVVLGLMFDFRTFKLK